MKPNTPDHFNYRPWLAAAVSAAFFIPLLVLGGPALAKSAASASQYEYGGSSQYQYRGKVTICHHTHSKKHPWVQISVGAPAAKAHLRHHDTLGPCPTHAAGAGGKDHGKRGDKGKKHDQGDENDQGQSRSASKEARAGITSKSSDHGKSGDHGRVGTTTATAATTATAEATARASSARFRRVSARGPRGAGPSPFPGTRRGSCCCARRRSRTPRTRR